MPTPAPTGPENDPAPLDLTGLHRTAWRLWIDGYQAGLRHGIAAGYADAGHDWTAVTATACRTAHSFSGASAEQLRARRSHYPTPALTAEQIHDQAARSWAPLDIPAHRAA